MAAQPTAGTTDGGTRPMAARPMAGTTDGGTTNGGTTDGGTTDGGTTDGGTTDGGTTDGGTTDGGPPMARHQHHADLLRRPHPRGQRAAELVVAGGARALAGEVPEGGLRPLRSDEAAVLAGTLSRLQGPVGGDRLRRPRDWIYARSPSSDRPTAMTSSFAATGRRDPPDPREHHHSPRHRPQRPLPASTARARWR